MDLEQASSLTVSGNLTNSGTVATNNQNLQGGANTLTVTGTLTNNTGANVTIGANNDTSDMANVGCSPTRARSPWRTGATLKLTIGRHGYQHRLHHGQRRDAEFSRRCQAGTLDMERGRRTHGHRQPD